jgi:flavin reductase (DIM6/NTAB) family NADH-FMN oxidoreductase RutF
MLLSAGKSQLLKTANYPRYDSVGLHDPQDDVEVWLSGSGEPINVTRNQVVAALRPFTIGVMVARNHRELADGTSVELRIEDRRRPQRTLGVIHLRPVRAIELSEHRFCLFETAGCENLCVPSASLRLYYLGEGRRARLRQRRNPYNFQMTPGDLRCMHVFYICPRPVVLVSVEHEESSNLFPMDLIGPTDSPWFSMALRSTSPAVRLMRESRRMALASIPFSYRAIAYKLAKHHRLPNIDWEGLPFETNRSPLYHLRVPCAALRVREVRVHEFHEVGSHTLFLTSVEHESVAHKVEGIQLFHAFGSYRRYWAE